MGKSPKFEVISVRAGTRVTYAKIPIPGENDYKTHHVEKSAESANQKVRILRVPFTDIEWDVVKGMNAEERRSAILDKIAPILESRKRRIGKAG